MSAGRRAVWRPPPPPPQESRAISGSSVFRNAKCAGGAGTHVSGGTPSALPVGGAKEEGGGVAWSGARVRPVCGQPDRPQRVFMGFFFFPESVFRGERQEVAG